MLVKRFYRLKQTPLKIFTMYMKIKILETEKIDSNVPFLLEEKKTYKKLHWKVPYFVEKLLFR